MKTTRALLLATAYETNAQHSAAAPTTTRGLNSSPMVVRHNERDVSYMESAVLEQGRWRHRPIEEFKRGERRRRWRSPSCVRRVLFPMPPARTSVSRIRLRKNLAIAQVSCQRIMKGDHKAFVGHFGEGWDCGGVVAVAARQIGHDSEEWPNRDKGGLARIGSDAIVKR